MNSERPHDLLSTEALRKLPPARQAKYRPITEEDQEVLTPMTEDERAKWLGQQPKKDMTPVDRLCIQKAHAKRLRRAAKKAKNQ